MSEPYSGVGAGLEVQVRAGDVAGRAGEADLLARGDRLADRDTDGRQVAVLGVRAVVHLDHDVVAVRAAPAGLDDRAGADRVDGGAGGGVEVDAGVAAGGPEGAAGLVAGGDVRAGDGSDEGVEALALGLTGGALLGLALRLGLLARPWPSRGLLAASASAFALAAASSAALLWAAAWASIWSASVSPMTIDLASGRSARRRRCRSAARAGAARVPTTPVVASAAMPAMPALVRCSRLGRRCFPVARVNAMEWLVLSFLLAYRVS